jgi:hypothetical protein
MGHTKVGGFEFACFDGGDEYFEASTCACEGGVMIRYIVVCFIAVSCCEE